MPYIGNDHYLGNSTSNFKVLDDIKSYIATFDGSSSLIVNITNDSIEIPSHRFVNGQRITYSKGAGNNVGGITDNSAYYIIKDGNDRIKLAASAADVLTSTSINLSSLGNSGNHSVTAAFDGVNKKFKATFHDGTTHTNVLAATQLNISINGVLQQPYNNATEPPNGYTLVNPGNIIVFSEAPESTFTFWGSIIADSVKTFDIDDNKIDNFIGDGATVDFTLSQTVPDNSAILVTIDGLVKQPIGASNSNDYSVDGNILTFTAAPSLGAKINVRHVGYAAPSGKDYGVTGFQGRTGLVTIVDSDPVVAIQSGGLGIGTVRTLNFVGAGNTFDVSGNTIDISVSSGIQNLVEDLTPELGGDLDLNGFDISGTGNLNVSGVSTFSGNVNVTGVGTFGSQFNYFGPKVSAAPDADHGITISYNTVVAALTFHDDSGDGYIRSYGELFFLVDADQSTGYMGGGYGLRITNGFSDTPAGSLIPYTINQGLPHLGRDAARYGNVFSEQGNYSGIVTATTFSGASQIGIQSTGTQIGAGITQLNFVGTGNTFAVNGTTVDVSIAGGGGSGENVVGETGFLNNVLSIANVGTVETNSTIEPVTGDDLTYVKYQDVKVNDNIDLTIASGDFILNVYDF